MKTINDLNIQGGDRVLLRVDFNVPTGESGEILNYFRIQDSLPTILDLQKIGARVIILAHKEEGSLEKVAEYLTEKIENFYFTKDTSPKHLDMQHGDVYLLENLRINKGEKANDLEFAQRLASLGEFFVNEAFSASHRKHASIVGIPSILGMEKCALGPKFQNEIEKLSLALSPKKPMFLLVGGAKFDTKLPMLEKFLNIADKIFVGGALAHSFWKQEGFDLQKSLVDDDTTLSEKVLIAQKEGKIFLPKDVEVENKNIRLPNEIRAGEKIVDFGPETLKEILQVVENSETIVWNGPVGYYEGGFDFGTKELVKNLGNMSEKTVIVGGGDTVTEIDKFESEGGEVNFTHISTGGGAMIDFLSNGTLPGIEAVTEL